MLVACVKQAFFSRMPIIPQLPPPSVVISLQLLLVAIFRGGTAFA
jgi:hypothetical protein